MQVELADVENHSQFNIKNFMSKKVTKETTNKTDRPRKFEYVFEDEDCTAIWKYDLDKQPNGPISVEHKYTAKYLKEMELRRKRGR